MLEKAAGMPKMRHLPTNGGGPAITALLGNNAQASTQTVLGDAAAHQVRQAARAGVVRRNARSKALPDVPTLKELGYRPRYYLWVGLFAPKGTPAAIVSTLSGAIDKAAAHRSSRPRSPIWARTAYLNAAEFDEFWDADAKRSGRRGEVDRPRARLGSAA